MDKRKDNSLCHKPIWPAQVTRLRQPKTYSSKEAPRQGNQRTNTDILSMHNIFLHPSHMGYKLSSISHKTKSRQGQSQNLHTSFPHIILTENIRETSQNLHRRKYPSKKSTTQKPICLPKGQKHRPCTIKHN